MEKDRVIPLFIAVCLFYVSGKLLSLLIRSGPWPYVIAAVASLVLGYVRSDDRMKNWLNKPDCSGKDRGLSVLAAAVRLFEPVFHPVVIQDVAEDLSLIHI